MGSMSPPIKVFLVFPWEKIRNIGTPEQFKLVYEMVMIFFLSLLIGAMADYVYLNGDNLSPIEFVGIVGGNLSVYLRIQNGVGKVLLKLCYFIKHRQESRELTNN